MATIFNKIPASGEKCVILDPREALVYPLNFGDWTEIRVSAAVSFTSLTNDNGIMPSGYVAASTNSKNSFLFGLMSGVDGALPFEAGTAYVGVGNRTGKYLETTVRSNGSCFASITINSGISPTNGSIDNGKLIDGFSSWNGFFTDAPLLSSAGGILNSVKYFSIGGGTATSPAPIMTFTESTGYCKIIGARFEVNNKGQTGQRFSVGFSNNGPSGAFANVSIAQLKQSNQLIDKDLTGLYYNSHLSPTGTPFSMPDKLIIQSPFQNSRLRVHSLLIEKYQ